MPVSMNRQPRKGQSIPTMEKANGEKIDVWLWPEIEYIDKW